MVHIRYTGRGDLYHCHAFAQDLETFYRLSGYVTDTLPDDLIAKAEELFRKARVSEEDFRKTLEEQLNVEKFIDHVFKGRPSDVLKQGSRLSEVLALFGVPSPPFTSLVLFPDDALTIIVDSFKDFVRSRFGYLMGRIQKGPQYVSEVIGHFYFSKAREYQMAGILETKVKKEPATVSSKNRLEVIDLPSLKNKATTLLAINTILSREWDRVRREWSEALERPLAKDNRAPAFIVVDEAHNLIPEETRGKAEYALREQFRTIVAEGRKYGLFLILVSQRPDKLDPLVLSECENKAIMKLSSGSVLSITKQMLGLDDLPPKLLEKTLDFETGRVLLVGRWAHDNPQMLYAAARRTVEGGRNLRVDYWATAPSTAREATSGEPRKLPRTRRSAKAGRRPSTKK